MSMKPQLPFQGIDVQLLVVTSLLLVTGLIMIASASIDIAEARSGNAFHYVTRHSIFIALGLIAALFVYQLPSSWWQSSGWMALSVAFFLLTLVLIPGIGKEVNGSIRWIGFGIL